MTDNDLDGAWTSRARTAAVAGIVYFTLLFGVGALLAVASRSWLEPLCGAAAALAIELTFMLPAAWLMNGLVARSFDITPGWPLGVIVAGTTAILLVTADFVVLALLDHVVAREIMNRGWLEARFVVQMLTSAIPLVYPRR